MKGLAEVGQLGRGYLQCKSRCNVKAKCRHALEEKCTVAREQNSEGPWALGSRPLRRLFRKGAAAPHCGRGCASLCKTVQHVIGCQYQVTHRYCPLASVTTPYLSPVPPEDGTRAPSLENHSGKNEKVTEKEILS